MKKIIIVLASVLSAALLAVLISVSAGGVAANAAELVEVGGNIVDCFSQSKRFPKGTYYDCGDCLKYDGTGKDNPRTCKTPVRKVDLGKDDGVSAN